MKMMDWTKVRNASMFVKEVKVRGLMTIFIDKLKEFELLISKKIEELNNSELDTSVIDSLQKQIGELKNENRSMQEKYDDKIKEMRKDIGILKRTKGKK